MLAKPAELELPLLGGGAEGHRESLFFSSMDNENRLESSDPYGQGPIFTAGFALFIASYLVGFAEWCAQHSRDANAFDNSSFGRGFGMGFGPFASAGRGFGPFAASAGRGFGPFAASAGRGLGPLAAFTSAGAGLI